MSKYKPGDVVMVPVTVVEVHPQGFPHGLHANGGANVHPDPHATPEAKAAALVELPDTVIASTPDGVSFDAMGRAHFKADFAL